MVLLVDDQATVGEAVRRMLAEQSDVDFHYCGNPAEAIDAVERIKPTVILQDLVMPGVDGLTLVRQYRANPATKDIPVIVLSTKEDPLVKSDAFSTGANDYLVIALDGDSLTASLHLPLYGEYAGRRCAESHKADTCPQLLPDQSVVQPKIGTAC